jgi:uncharacterized protein YegL
VLPLVEASQFTAPVLLVGGGTALSRGLAGLREAIAREFKLRSGDYLGDWQPLVFLLTDGQPNPGDPWKEQFALLTGQKGRRPGLFVAIGAGPDADELMLKELAPENTYMLSDLDQTKVKSLFAWIAASTVTASKTPGALGQPGGQVLPPAPPNLFATNP